MTTGNILLACLLWLSGWAVTSCLPHQYHLVSTPMTWAAAQTHCRQTYTDLATIDNNEEVNRIKDTVSGLGNGSEFWIGLYSEINWKWSDGDKGSKAEYRNWFPKEPNLSETDEFCVTSGRDGWWDLGCFREIPFICYNGTQSSPNLVLVEQQMNWHNAQRYCRENFIDLATLKNLSHHQEAWSLINHVTSWAWIGLHRDPQEYWSDGSSSSFRNWVYSQNQIGSRSRICVSMDLEKYGRWKTMPCDLSLPFVCYNTPVRLVTKHVLKLRIKKQDSSVDLNEDAVKEEVLRKLQERLKESGVDGVSLRWREQSDGEVFHEEKEKKVQRKEL